MEVAWRYLGFNTTDHSQLCSEDKNWESNRWRPFENGDLKKVYKMIDEWVAEASSWKDFGNRSVSKYYKLLFRDFIQFLDESDVWQHEVWNRTWKDVKVGETLTNCRRSIITISMPQRAKSRARKSVFQGDSRIEIMGFRKRYALRPPMKTSYSRVIRQTLCYQSRLSLDIGYL